MNQSELETNTCNRRQARERNGLSFTSDWSRKRRELFNQSQSEVKQNQSKTRITLDTQTALMFLISVVTAKTQHIMVSYQWDSQATVLQVKDKLTDAGFTVWIDVENMTGSTLESMASAVENCTVFLMAVSRKYLESPNCRSGKRVFNVHFEKHLLTLYVVFSRLSNVLKIEILLHKLV